MICLFYRKSCRRLAGIEYAAIPIRIIINVFFPSSKISIFVAMDTTRRVVIVVDSHYDGRGVRVRVDKVRLSLVCICINIYTIHICINTHLHIYCISIVYIGTDANLEYLYMSSDMTTRLILPSPAVTVHPLHRWVGTRNVVCQDFWLTAVFVTVIIHIKIYFTDITTCAHSCSRYNMERCIHPRQG